MTESPTQGWVTGWTSFLTDTLPVLFLVVVVGFGIVVLVRKGDKKKRILGGLKGAIVFGLGAALVYLLLTNVVGVADWFRGELPVDP